MTALKKIEFPADLGCNVTDEIILSQVAENIRRGLPFAQPHNPNPDIIALVCGGPSLAKTEKQLVEAVWRGAKVVCVNGTYRWCIERNIKPSVMVMLDAREFNTRFVEPDAYGCRYLLASQCHPRAFDICRDREVTIWHACSAGQAELDMLNQFYGDDYYPVTLGTTVAIRAISLLRMLGFQSFDIFGLDSCWFDDRHHAYAQPENDDDRRISVWAKDSKDDPDARQFICAPWMAKQADDFMQLVRERGDKFRLNVRGDGLIATIMQKAAARARSQEE